MAVGFLQALSANSLHPPSKAADPLESQELVDQLSLGLTFDQLAVVRTVASTGSFREAAKLLCLTQPAVSQRVRQIERLVGRRIFDRHMGVGVTLTPIGESLLDFCERSMRGLNELATEITGHDNGRQPDFAIAAPSDVIEYLLLPSLADMEARHPLDGVRLQQGSTHDAVLQMVSSGSVDLAFDRWPTPSSLLTLARMQEHLYLVARPEHELLRLPVEDRPHAIDRYPFAAYASGMRSRGLIQRWAGRIGASLMTHLECRNVSTMKALVLRNNAISVVPGVSVMTEIANHELEIVDIAEMPLNRSLAISTRAGQDKLERVHGFVDDLVEYWQQLPEFALSDVRRTLS